MQINSSRCIKEQSFVSSSDFPIIIAGEDTKTVWKLISLYQKGHLLSIYAKIFIIFNIFCA